MDNPRRRAPFGMSYRHPELIPPLKFRPHPQSCAVSTHRPMKARELASSAERLSSRATPTNTTCHAAELHVRPRSCRAFARRRRESSPPIDASFQHTIQPRSPLSPVDFLFLFILVHSLGQAQSVPFCFCVLALRSKTIVLLSHSFVLHAEEKRPIWRSTEDREEDTETLRGPEQPPEQPASRGARRVVDERQLRISERHTGERK